MQNPTAEQSLNAEAILSLLGPRSFIKRVNSFEVIDSTNAFAKGLAGAGVSEPTLVIAEEQSQGRGRFGRRWVSERGKNLTFSILVKPTASIELTGAFPLCVAAGVAQAIDSFANVRTETKWPNDLLVEGKKVCGILLESVLAGHTLDALVVGIGLNVNQETFPPGINATSLRLCTGRWLDRLVLLGRIVENLRWLSENLASDLVRAMLRSWEQRTSMFGKTVSIVSGRGNLSGRAKRILEDGSLVIECGGKELVVLAGEVTMVRG